MSEFQRPDITENLHRRALDVIAEKLSTVGIKHVKAPIRVTLPKIIEKQGVNLLLDVPELMAGNFVIKADNHILMHPLAAGGECVKQDLDDEPAIALNLYVYQNYIIKKPFRTLLYWHKDESLLVWNILPEAMFDLHQAGWSGRTAQGENVLWIQKKNLKLLDWRGWMLT
jgi:hypothetical protein